MCAEMVLMRSLAEGYHMCVLCTGEMYYPFNRKQWSKRLVHMRLPWCYPHEACRRQHHEINLCIYLHVHTTHNIPSSSGVQVSAGTSTPSSSFCRHSLYPERKVVHSNINNRERRQIKKSTVVRTIIEWTEWLCGDSVFYAKRGRGGTGVSVMIICDKKEKRQFGKGARIQRERNGKKGEWSWWAGSPLDHHGIMPVVR